MKTKEILDKYRKILSGLLKLEEDSIKFYRVNQQYIDPSMFKVMMANENTIEIKEIEYFEPEKDEQGNETGEQIRHTRCNNWSEGKYIVVNDKKQNVISSFELYKMPHCCAILVSCKAFVCEEYRNKRIGTVLNQLRQDIGRLLGYSLLMCTDIAQNVCQRKLLATNGWKDIYEVKNKRTGNTVFLSVINL